MAKTWKEVKNVMLEPGVKEVLGSLKKAAQGAVPCKTELASDELGC